ncbi:MlaD family protein [[Mycobacterium] nativiensis]|uniref:MlaD family protein n=1 Tax=[Mycobacterium] nativiensis TaxID=2855503 RepID=A0ABU5XVL3_9MYCO|nr:MlaD family protein [Mycolicibacter sp. MYC340]MEB3031983.1 MlaD family protein [Mycolicibacter sp. MYC340]
MTTFSDPSGRTLSPQTLRLRGLIVAVVLGIVGSLLYHTATGGFADTFRLTVVTNTIGEGLAPGAEVKFHGLAIGSVKTLDSIGYNKQKMTVELDPRQARALTADTTAQFTSSNVFGSAAVELVSSGIGEPLSANQTLVMSTDAQATSITGLLRQAGKLGGIVDSPEFGQLIDAVRRHSDLIQPVARSSFDLAKILADAQTVPFSQSLAVISSFVTGVNDFVPLVGLVNNLLDGLDFLVQPGGTEQTNEVLQQIGRLLSDAGSIVVKNKPWLSPLITGMMNTSVPLMFTLGSLAPAYDRLSGLVDRTSTAFPFVDDRIRMQVELTIDTVPGLSAALPDAPAGGGR